VILKKVDRGVKVKSQYTLKQVRNEFNRFIREKKP